MNQYLTFMLPVYMVLYFLVLLEAPALIVGGRIGKSPIVLSVSDDAHGLIARYFGIWMVLVTVYVVAFAFFPAYYIYFKPIQHLEHSTLAMIGLVILTVSLIWTSAAQINMQASWRVGIDEKQKTALVNTGIFHFSRNPIYLGMIATHSGAISAHTQCIYFAACDRWVCIDTDTGEAGGGVFCTRCMARPIWITKTL